MKSIYIRNLALALFIVFVGQNALAQDNNSKNKEKKKSDKKEEQILSEKVVVTKSYTPTIKKASKLDITPSTEKSALIDIPQMKYGINYKPERFPFKIKTLGIPLMPASTDEKMYNNYADLMFGAPLSSRANLYYTTTSQRNLMFGAALNHKGFYGKLKNDIGEKLSALDMQNMININLRYKRGNFQTGITAQQSYDLYNRYGYSVPVQNPSESNNNIDDDSQHFMKSNVEFNIGTSFDNASAFNIRFNGAYNNVSDKYKYKEDIYHAGLFVSKGFNEVSLASFKVEYMSILPNSHFQLDQSGVVGDIKTRSVQNVVGNNILFAADYTYKAYSSLALTPRYEFVYKGFEIDVAPKVIFDFGGGNGDGKTKTLFLPEATVSLSLFSGGLKPYVKIDGNYIFNSYYTLSTINPYIKEGLTAPNTTIRNYKIGIEGIIGGRFTYNLSGGLSNLRNLLMFCNINRGNVFDVITGDFDNAVLTAELGYVLSQKFILEGKYEYIDYDDNAKFNESNIAYGYPKHNVSLQLIYSPSKSLSFNVAAKIMGERQFISNTYDALSFYTAKPTYDLSLGAEYKINSRLSTIIRFENILDQKLYPWANYRGVGFNGLAGLSYKF